MSVPIRWNAFDKIAKRGGRKRSAAGRAAVDGEAELGNKGEGEAEDDDDSDANGNAASSASRQEDEEEASNDGDDDSQDSDQEMIDINPLIGGTINPLSKELAPDTETIQIIDLETSNPLVAYKGHTFSCRWAENIGTELLYTQRNEADPLPGLRSLEDNVDLLAASSARLISTELKLEQKQKAMIRPSTSSREPILNVPVSISVHSKAPPEKKVQANFLEQLAAIKKSKGEEDEVTVHAKRRRLPAEWRLAIEQQKQAELEELKALMAAGGTVAEETRRKVEILEKALQELSVARAKDPVIEETEIAKKRKRRFLGEYKEDSFKRRAEQAREAKAARGPSQKAYKPRARTSQPIRSIGPRLSKNGKVLGRPRGSRRELSTASIEPGAGADVMALSTPTPTHWNEIGLEGQGDTMDEG